MKITTKEDTVHNNIDFKFLCFRSEIFYNLLFSRFHCQLTYNATLRLSYSKRNQRLVLLSMGDSRSAK